MQYDIPLTFEHVTTFCKAHGSLFLTDVSRIAYILCGIYLN